MLRRHRIGLRLAWIALSFGLPMTAALVYVVLRGVQKDVTFGVRELEGTRYQRPLFELMVTLAGSGSAASSITRPLAALEPIDAELGAALQTGAAALERRGRGEAALAKLRAQAESLGATRSGDAWRAARRRLAENARTLFAHVGDTSNLILDPDLDSYYLMDATNLALPELVMRLQAIRELARGLAEGRPGASEGLRDEALLLARSDLPRVAADVRTALVEDPGFYGASASLQERLPPALAEFETRGAALLDAARAAAAAGGTAPELVAATGAALAATESLWTTAVAELDRLLEIRIADYRRSRSLALALAGGAAALASLLAAAIARSITRPLAEASELARRVAAGDLRTAQGAAQGAGAHDEIADLGRALEEMSGGLRRLIAQVDAAVGSVDEAVGALGATSEKLASHLERQEIASHEIALTAGAVTSAAEAVTVNAEGLLASAEETSDATAGLGDSVGQTAARMDVLSASIEEIASSIGQMGASVRGIAERAAELLRASDDALGAVAELRASEREVADQASATRAISEAVAAEAHLGEGAVSETIEAMGGIRDSFAHVEVAIGELSARSSEIGDVVSVIDDVSAESALLSLNAAIIAAQAGSHGRAFGVVADEIHALAERTSQSSGEIGKLVRAVRGDIERSVAAVAEGRVRVETGAARSEGAGRALAVILERCGDAVARASDILHAGAAQSARLSEVERAFASVREGVEAMGDVLREHGSASAGVLRIADEVRVLGADVKNLTVAQRGETDRSVRALEGVAERTRQVRSAVDGQRASCNQIRRALDGLRGGSQETAAAARELREVLTTLAERAGRLSQELERFTL